MAIAPEERIGVEAETRLRDGQATWRRTQRKRDADRTVGSVILLLADTRANRLALKEIRRSVRAELPSTPERCSRRSEPVMRRALVAWSCCERSPPVLLIPRSHLALAASP